MSQLVQFMKSFINKAKKPAKTYEEHKLSDFITVRLDKTSGLFNSYLNSKNIIRFGSEVNTGAINASNTIYVKAHGNATAIEVLKPGKKPELIVLADEMVHVTLHIIVKTDVSCPSGVAISYEIIEQHNLSAA